MSLDALRWVQQLPLDLLDLAPYRVLSKLADAHNTETGVAWRSIDRLAAELRCHKRTVQRAVKALEQLGLIVRADQVYVQHLRADRRPTVYQLPLDRWGHHEAVQPELDGVTPAVTPPGAVDNSHGVTAAVAHGVTAGVALEQDLEQVTNYPAQPQTARAVDRRTMLLSDAACINPRGHYWPTDATWCDWCGISIDGTERLDHRSGRRMPA